MKMKRKIVKIDQDKCTGCGLCVNACAEGAIQMVDGKAKLVSDVYCDGLGACLGDCPYGAISIEEREAEVFNENAVKNRLAEIRKPEVQHSGCPGMKMFSMERKTVKKGASPSVEPDSELSQWPIQLHLVPVSAPYFEDSDLLLAADCTAFALGSFHGKLLSGRKLIIACPKLDDSGEYTEKLSAIIKKNNVKSITAARMEVPCCGGIANFAREARRISGKNIPLKVVVIGIDGSIKSETEE
ncbi:MAG TPA: 4Fe-4S binding protein [Victivallales bacterium]|nr:4Fe-4S binding protein [Victivallales bacterium]